MYNNQLIDRDAFSEGYLSVLKEAGIGDSLWNNTLGLFGKHGTGTQHLSAGGGGIRDSLWNSATDTAGKFMNESTSKAMNNGMDKTLNQAGQSLGAGAVSGGVNEAGNQINKGMDWLGSKGNELMGQAKNFGTNLLNDPMKTIGDNPWTSAGLGAGVLGAGYFGGKALGLWGNDNKPASNGQGPSNSNMSSNGQPPPMMQSAYTQGYTPMALQKASADFPVPPMLMERVNPALNLGSSIYSALNGPEESQVPEQKEILVTPENARVNKLLQNPKMKAYITSLIKDTSPPLA